MFILLAIVLFLAEINVGVTINPGGEFSVLILVIMVCTHEICKTIKKTKEE